jgi:hypothetical protein
MVEQMILELYKIGSNSKNISFAVTEGIVLPLITGPCDKKQELLYKFSELNYSV